MKKQWTSIFFGILLIWPGLLIAQQKKIPPKKAFCAFCGGVYSPEQKVCPGEKFPLVLSSSTEQRWVWKEQKRLTKRPSRSKFYKSFTLHKDLLKRGETPSIQASYYAALEKYAHFMEPKNLDLAVTFLNEILLREKTGGPFYKRAISLILQLWRKKSLQSTTEKEREKYFKKIIRPGIFPEKLAEKTAIYREASLNLAKIYFRRGLEQLKKGIEENSFEERFRAEDTWFTIDLVLKDKGHIFYKFVETCRLYFDLEAFYNLKKYKLVREMIERMERDFARYQVAEFPHSKLPFWQKMHQIKKELKKSGN